MRIIYIIWNTHIGGTEGWVIRNSKALMMRGHQIIIWSIFGKGDFPITAKSYKINILPPSYTWRGFIFNLITIIRVIKNYNKPFIIHSFGLKCDLLAKVFFGSDPNIHIVSGIRSVDPWRNWGHHIIQRFRQSKIEKWISNSKVGKRKFIERYKVKDEMIKVVYNDVSVSSIKRTKYNISTPKIVFLGNIQERKGVYELFKAVQILKNEDIYFRVHLYGNDFTKNKILNLVSDMDIDDRIKYHGFVFDKENIFRNALFLIAPSYWEGLSNSILEALSFGVPVVSTAVGGTPEIIRDRWNGLLVQPKDEKELANAMKALLLNPKIAKLYGINGRKEVQRLCDPVKLINDLISIYETVL